MKKFIVIFMVLFFGVANADTIININTEMPKEKKELNWMVRSTAGGYDLRYPDIYPKEENDYHTSSMGLFYRLEWSDKMNIWVGPSVGILAARGASAPIFGIDTLFRYKPFRNIGLYLQPYLGAYYGANVDDLPHMGSKLPIGKAGFEIGYQWERFGIGYAPVEHYSSIPDFNDCGWNVGVISLSIKF